MDAIAAHKDQLQKLLEELASDSVISGVTFVTLVNAYIMRLDTDSELTFGPNIDSQLCALIRASQNFKTARRVLSKTSRCAHTSAGRLHGTAARQTVRASNPLARQRTLIDVKQQVKQEDGVKEIKPESTSCGQNCNGSNNVSGKPKYLFRGMVK